MNKTKLIIIAASVVAAVGSLTGLGVVYARFQKANKAVKTTTIGEMLRKEDVFEPDESTSDDEKIEAVEAAEKLEGASMVESQDVESKPVLTVIKNGKEGKQNAVNTPTEGN